MGVIVTGMKMPESCVECDKRRFNKCYMNGVMAIEHEYRNNNKKINPDCPLKSVDGLIEKIKEHNECHRDEIDGLYMNDILEIVKEYCEMEDENGKRKT